MKKQVIFADDAKNQILEGAELLYKAVSTTLGPKGQNAVIEAYGEPIVTHDGVTVAKAVEVESKHRPGVRVGIDMIKSSSSKTNDNVGDGTTSSTIIAYHLINEGMKLKDKNPMVLRRELEVGTAKVLEALHGLSEELKTEKATIEVATISSENVEIGREIGKMFHKLGKDGMVTVEIGTKPVTEYEIVEGYTFDRGVINQLMITDHRTQTTTVNNPPIIIAHQNIGLSDVEKITTELYESGEDSLVIIADDFKNELIDWALQKSDLMQIVCIKAPGFGDQRPELLSDIAALTGTKVFGTGFPKKIEEISIEDVGSCEKIVTTSNETVITGGKKVDEYIKTLETKLAGQDAEFDRDKLEKRIARLRAKIGEVRVGGITEMEAEERKYLIDDAIAATEAAMKEGIVPGGGVTYVQLSKVLDQTIPGEKILYEALLAPFKVLMKNSGERYGTKLEELKEFGKGFDVMSGSELVDMKEHGIIDPVLVIKQAITNAASVAGSALTTGVLLTMEKDDDASGKD